MSKTKYEYEPYYLIYKKYQNLENEISKGNAYDEAISLKNKLLTILLREAPYYLYDVN